MAVRNESWGSGKQQECLLHVMSVRNEVWGLRAAAGMPLAVIESAMPALKALPDMMLRMEKLLARCVAAPTLELVSPDSLPERRLAGCHFLAFLLACLLIFFPCLTCPLFLLIHAVLF